MKKQSNGTLGNQKPIFTVRSRLGVFPFHKRQTIGQIKGCLLSTLQENWQQTAETSTATHILTSNNIHIYEFKEGTLLELSDNGTTIDSGKLLAIEFFDVTPVDLYRMVGAGQLFPWVHIDPDSGHRHLTERVPLYTAAMTEADFPFISTKDGESIEVHGVSLWMKGVNEKPLQHPVDPFRPVGENEMPGVETMTLKQLQLLADEKGFECHESAGVLVTNISHYSTPRHPPLPKFLDSRVSFAGNQIERQLRATNGLANQRNVYFRFVVEEGTNLSELGMGLVFDENGHWTMVQTNETPQREWSIWTQASSPVFRSSFLPDGPRLDALISTANNPEEFKDCLRDILAPDDEEPETSIVDIGLKRYVVFPKVAAKAFAPSDLLLKASAEPREPKNLQDNQEQLQLFKAALVLYHANTNYDVVLAIEALEAADYVPDHIDDFSRSCLLDAMNQAQLKISDEETFAEMGLGESGWNIDDCFYILCEGSAILVHGTFKANPKPVSVHTRLKEFRFDSGTTINQIKQDIFAALKSSWGELTTLSSCCWTSQNIHIYSVAEGGKLLEQLDGQTPISHGKLHAVEIFGVAPVDLYRTVGTAQLHPWVHIDPDSDQQHLTKRVPLYTAAMKGAEAAFPFVSLTNDGTVVVHGVSLWMKGVNEKPLQDPVDPFHPVHEEERPRVNTMTLEQLQQLADKKGFNNHEAAGVLVTGLSHEDVETYPPAKKPTPNYTKNKDKQQRRAREGLANRRDAYFRFELKEGTNLLELGMGLVPDKKDHWTMVRLKETSQAKWNISLRDELVSPASRSSFLPVGSLAVLDSKASHPQQFKACLRDIFAPKKGKEPETAWVMISGERYMVLPKVASKAFTPNGVLLKTSAEPQQPGKLHDRDSQEQLYKAALVLYHTSDSYDVLLAIEALEAVDYVAEFVDGFAHSFLLDVMNEAKLKVSDEDMSAGMGLCELLGWSPEECEEAIDEGVAVLERGFGP